MGAMTRADIQAKLQDVFRQVFDDASIVLQPGTTARDIPAWDSLNQIKIILGCGIRLRPREINALENVDEMVGHLATAVAAQRAGA
jgi:acyl carrier protein